MKNIRVRIAPSPTGDPHVGTAYIALFNLIYARKHRGQFILRIEDTDQNRARSSSEEQIIKALKWLGIEWQEGPDIGGNYGPYRQSERLAIYHKHVEKLLNSGHAYRCFCDQDRLTELRRQQRLQGMPTGYDRFCRSLSQEEVEKKLFSKAPHVVRLKMPTEGSCLFRDAVRGDLSFDYHRLDDQVLLKSDGFPTYHLASVVDDHLMEITHVIRAEEWISSTPKHVYLYKAFGWQEPVWVHMPLLRNPDKSKISKRKNPVSILYYQKAGYLPKSLINFLALMGWSFGKDQEIFSQEQMQEKFDFKDIHLGGPVFDILKLRWLNQLYMQKLSADEFTDYLHRFLFNKDYLKSLYPLVLERMDRFEQFIDHNSFFFNGSLLIDLEAILPKAREIKSIQRMLSELIERLDELDEWNTEALKILLTEHKNFLGWKSREYFMFVRFVLTGRADSPPLFETISVLGREIVRFRIRETLKVLLHKLP